MEPWQKAAMIATAATSHMESVIPAADRQTVAMSAAWEASRRWTGETGESGEVRWCVMRAKGAVIDHMRSFAGRPDRRRRYQLVSIEGLDGFEPEDATEPPRCYEGPSLDALLVQLAETPTEQLVCIGLAYGTPQQDIARWLGVTPSRVSQIVRAIRERAHAQLADAA